MDSGDRLTPLREEEEFDRAISGGLTVLYKHSDRCFMCRGSLRQVEQFAEERPEVPVYIIDVIGQRALSSRIAERLGVPHESPQAILIQDGTPVWNGSHSSVTAGTLERELERLAEMG